MGSDISVVVTLLIIAIAPSVALLSFIYTRDKYDKEPLPLLIKLFSFGALLCIPAAFIENLLSIFGQNPLWQAFGVAAFTEESGKFAILLFFTLKHKDYNEKIDGIVYGTFISLGFATLENILYVLGNGLAVGIMRAVLAVPGHMLWGITMGYYFSLYKFSWNRSTARRFLYCSLIVPLSLHGIYDYIIMAKLFTIFIPLIILIAFLWYFNIKKLNIYVEESKSQWINKPKNYRPLWLEKANRENSFPNYKQTQKAIWGNHQIQENKTDKTNSNIDK
jgi:protease PrsW